ncbi:MAG: bifunctional (p)ppGpp synthetase/guanosine-3',5'-bis(diphosphate) 3'-pyrophosphohydrolase [Pseudomonadota bacterium]
MPSPARSALHRWLDQYPDHAEHAELIQHWANTLTAGSDQETLAARMLKALAPLAPDSATLAAVLAIVHQAQSDSNEMRAMPNDVTQLVEQFQQVVQFDQRFLADSTRRAEGLRRLILALIADVRVVLIVLAWQLARMQLAREPELRQTLARETQAIHGPLANRLGIWQLKWQLEDLAFRYLEPAAHARIERLVAEQHSDRERSIDQFMQQLSHRLGHAGIEHEISGRAKHIYSIWRKMQRKGLDFHDLFDVRAVRVLVEDLADCYAALGITHTHWQPVPGEFDDYISQPKPNLYRSLHTAVRGPSERVFEVQIRTHEMHEHAELGVAAHWRYKEGGPQDKALEQRIGVMRQLIDQSDSAEDDDTLIENFESLTDEDRVYVLTPRGDVIDLAHGSTALDFAYHVHTEVGHRCRGAKVNGRIVPLTHMLANGDRVEVLTGKQPQPSRDWLLPQLGYLRSARARGKVRHFFRQQNYEDNLMAGRQRVEAELQRLDLDEPDLQPIAEQYNFTSPDDLMAAVGAGDLTPGQVAQAALRLMPEPEPEVESIVRKLPVRRQTPPGDSSKSEIRIEGVGNLLHQLAKCCQPLPGDPIAGFITLTRGVSIHREDCGQYLRMAERQPERRIQVEWAAQKRSRYPVRLKIQAWDRRELIKDIGSVLAARGIDVIAMQAGRGEQPEAVEIEITVEVGDLEQLSAILAKLQNITNVTSVRRVRDGHD